MICNIIRIYVTLLFLVTLVSVSIGQALPISDVLRDSGKYLNGSVSVRGIVSEKGESPDALRAKYKVVLKEGDSSIAVYMDSAYESLPEIGKPYSATGILKTENNEIFIHAVGGFNWLLVVLTGLGVTAVVLVWALVRKPSAQTGVGVSKPQTSVSGLKVPCTNPDCRQMIPPTDAFCEYCGQDQSKPIKSSTVAAPIKPSPQVSSATSADQTIIETGADRTVVEVAAAKLVATEGPSLDMSWAIPGGETTIGRETGNRIQLEGANVSKKHAVIRVEGDSVVVEDLNSTNGTYVNGQRITKQELSNGDKLKIGSHVILFSKIS